jgi:nitrogen regulatory protein PII 2
VKEIMAIIRPKKVSATKDALEALGYPGITASAVLGRGKQRGIAGEISFSDEAVQLTKGRSGGMEFVPKRLINIIVEDKQVDAVVKAILKVNKTDQIGDGRIFITPIDNVLRVRTGETGNVALN